LWWRWGKVMRVVDPLPITSFQEVEAHFIDPPSPAASVSGALLPRVVFALALLVGSMVAAILVRTS
jgi:hypothetical protein